MDKKLDSTTNEALDSEEESSDEGRKRGQVKIASVALRKRDGSKAKSPPKKRKKSSNKPKDSNQPQRPLSAYNYFFRDQRYAMVEDRRKRQEEAKAEGKTLDTSEESGHKLFSKMGKAIAAKWNSLSTEERRKYDKMAAEDSARYRKEMDAYYKKEEEKRKKEHEAFLAEHRAFTKDTREDTASLQSVAGVAPLHATLDMGSSNPAATVTAPSPAPNAQLPPDILTSLQDLVSRNLMSQRQQIDQQFVLQALSSMNAPPNAAAMPFISSLMQQNLLQNQPSLATSLNLQALAIQHQLEQMLVQQNRNPMNMFAFQSLGMQPPNVPANNQASLQDAVQSILSSHNVSEPSGDDNESNPNTAPSPSSDGYRDSS